MSKTIRVVYYTDIDDNTKTNLCAIPSDTDMRNSSIITKIAEHIAENFTHRPLIVEHSLEMAKAIAFHEFADMYEYEFGVEETPVIEC